MEQIYSDSNYRFTDPIRFFKANDPYYFEVDNIPLKQLQENCLWLKDQLQKLNPQLTAVKRVDIDELRPYVSGGDRTVRVKPGRYTARINDASTRTPLNYLRKVTGDIAGDMDIWAGTLPSEGASPESENIKLQNALNTFKSRIASEALGMNGLAERAFTWAIRNSDYPMDDTGTRLGDGPGVFSYFGPTARVPFLITQALLWLRSPSGLASAETILTVYKTNNEALGFNELPKVENYFIKAWRGITRLAVVDVEDEITVEVPPFNPEDFSYIDENGEEVPVTGVTQRIDLVFIYSKPVDMSGVNIITPEGKQALTKPALGIVRGAGIKNRFTSNLAGADTAPGIVAANASILAHPGDQVNTNMGFTATSSNELEYSIRGSFPSPDDILNIAPLISEKLEDSAYELIGQSILPVAYVFVQSNSQVVLSTDLIDIRPFFRTAELSYNERAGIAGAFPQLSLANPAVGKAQMDYEIRRMNIDLRNRIDLLQQEVPSPAQSTSILATGYIFGGWYFGPEGALYDFYRKDFADDSNTSNDSLQYIRNYVTTKYAYGSDGATINIPTYPDWDMANWCSLLPLQEKGHYPNDYINTFLGDDSAIVAGSFSQKIPTVAPGTLNTALNNLTKQSKFTNMHGVESANSLTQGFLVLGGMNQRRSTANFHYISKKIKFNRPSWLADYDIDIQYINCLAQNNIALQGAGSYFGHWVEKGFDEFTVYIAFVGPNNNVYETFSTNPIGTSPYPAPTNSTSVTSRGGDIFSCFLVPVSDILYSNPNPIGGTTNSRSGYYGNPRVGKCTYPTVMWKFTGVPNTDAASYLRGDLNSQNPIINLKGYTP